MNENDYYTCNHKSYSDCIAELDVHLKALNVQPLDIHWLYNEILPYNLLPEKGDIKHMEKKLKSLNDSGPMWGWCVVNIRNTSTYFELDIDIRLF